jgi:uncharacterized hydrophobic protein (TIGR00341 family)
VRLVQASIPAGKRQAVLDSLDAQGIDYVVTDETSHRKYTAVVYFPLPTNAVEGVLSSLREVGLDDDAYTVVIDAETVISREFEKLQQRHETDEDHERIAREEIRTKARELMPTFRIYVVMSVISAMVATAGLLLNSPAVVVGSMVIAPILGPAMATSVGTVIHERDLFRAGVKFQLIGFGVAVLGSIGFAAFVKAIFLVPPGLDVISLEQVSLRQEPGFLSLVVALGAGVAGALSLSAGISAALVGVMIAAALIPPTAAIGIGVVWNIPSLMVGSSVLVAVNAISINLAALAVLWYSGYRPSTAWKAGRARTETVKRIAVLVVAIGLLSVVLAGTTYTEMQAGTFRTDTREEVRSVLASESYEELELLELTVESNPSLLGRESDRVVVTVGRPTDEEYPALAEALHQRIRQRTGRDVAIQVRFVDVQSAAGSDNSNRRLTLP